MIRCNSEESQVRESHMEGRNFHSPDGWAWEVLFNANTSHRL